MHDTDKQYTTASSHQQHMLQQPQPVQIEHHWNSACCHFIPLPLPAASSILMVVAVISSQAALLRGELDAVMGVFETSYRVEICSLRVTPRTGVGVEGWLEGRHARFSSRGERASSQTSVLFVFLVNHHILSLQPGQHYSNG
jgi:hypothetical protein